MRPNLYLSLKHLRQTSISRVLWVDAICINQDNQDERSIEVKRMGQIYTLAWRVVVWLGPDNADRSGERALEALEWLGRQIENTQDGFIILSPEAAEGPDQNCLVWEPEYQLSYNEKDYLAIRDLLEKPWVSAHAGIILCHH
jgi:hypothetical protein